jgi:radical SAM superfamily enzyme YgiQ (UPF0313 family)
MKVLLINPPRENELVGNNPPIIDEERGFNPPLGLLYLGGYLRARSRHEVEVIDAQVEELGYPELKARIAAARPDIAGLTAMTFTLLDVLKTVALIKEVSPQILTVIGGVHAFLYPTETLRQPGVDFVLAGEAEETFARLVDEIASGKKFEAVPGLTWRDGSSIRQNPPPPLIADLDSLPFPDRTLTPYPKYSSVVAKRLPITTMFTSRGCPFRCSFCSRPHLGKTFRARSADNVVDEMEACARLGIKELLIYDDTFTVNRERVHAVADEILRRDLDIGWDIRARVDCVDARLLERIKAARCERIHFGIEAGTEKILQVLNKGITLAKAKEAVALTRKTGIQTLAYFMIGAPTETRDDILRTIDFALELDADFVHITILSPFPATEIYARGLREGLFKTDVWQAFAEHPRPGFHPPYWNATLRDEELQELLKLAYRKFYTRPSYVLRKIAQVSSFREFATKAKAGLKMLRMKSR